MSKGIKKCMRKDAKGMTTFVTTRAGLRCIACKKELTVGELRYPVWISESFNRCADCYYSITESKPQKVFEKAYQS